MAFFKGSAYEFTPLFEATATGEAVFRGLRARRIRRPEPVLEHTVVLKERLDSLAHEYYAEGRDWRWLVEANPDILFPEDLLWTASGPADADSSDTVDPDRRAQQGRERVGHVIIVARREDTR